MTSRRNAGLTAVATVLAAGAIAAAVTVVRAQARLDAIQAASLATAMAGPVRLEISQRIVDQRSLRGVGVGLAGLPEPKRDGLLSEFSVSPDGEITMRVRTHGQRIVITPSFDGRMFHWRCRGEPAEDVPASCRG